MADNPSVCGICLLNQREIRSKYCFRCNYTLNTVQDDYILLSSIKRVLINYYKKKRIHDYIMNNTRQILDEL